MSPDAAPGPPPPRPAAGDGPPAAAPAGVEVREETAAALAAYASIPIAFEVRERLAVVAPDAGLGGLPLVLERVPAPYVKDYDAMPGEHPTAWPTRFDVTRWGILSAWVHGTRAGGAVVRDAPPADAPAGGDARAVLWDLRVAPRLRGRGVGAALFRAAERWAAARGASWLEAETQNVNVAACRFYARQGCTLGALDRFAYPTLPDEARLLWRKPVGRAGG